MKRRLQKSEAAWSKRGKWILLGRALNGDVTKLSERIREECREIATASNDEVGTGCRPEQCEVRFTVLVVISNGRLITVLSELGSVRHTVRTPSEEPDACRWAKDRDISSRIAVEVSVDWNITILSPDLLSYCERAAIERVPDSV